VPWTVAEEAAVRALFERSPDYFEAVEGRPPIDDDASTLFSDLPPGRSPADKRVLGVTVGDGPAVGVVDLVRDWPAPGTWIIGLVLLEPAARRRGTGTRVVATIAELVIAEGGERLRAAAHHRNPGADSFWRSLGFTAVDDDGEIAVFESAAFAAAGDN